MKKIMLVMLLFLGLGFGASAQVHGRGGGGKVYVRPRVTIIGGGYGYSPYLPYGPYLGYGFGFNPYYTYPGMYHSYRPSKLSLQIEDIKNDYKDRIWSAKHDKDLSRRERRAKVQELKHERDGAIIDAKRNYYKTDVKA